MYGSRLTRAASLIGGASGLALLLGVGAAALGGSPSASADTGRSTGTAAKPTEPATGRTRAATRPNTIRNGTPAARTAAAARPLKAARGATRVSPVPAPVPSATASAAFVLPTPEQVVNDLLVAVESFGAALRNLTVPILANRTPVANEQQIATVSTNAATGPIAFNAFDADNDRLVYTVNPQGTPGGPSHGTVTVDNTTGTFTYTPGTGFATTGFDTFTYSVSDDTGLHLHSLPEAIASAFGLLGAGLFGGHRDLATVSLFASSSLPDRITDELSVLTYNIAGLPEPLSSAIYPRAGYTVDISQRLNRTYTVGGRTLAIDLVGVQEDFAYHSLLIHNTLFPDASPADPPPWLWPIGVPFSSGVNTLSAFKLGDVTRQTWNRCALDNCLTPKGLTYTQIQLPGGEKIDVYNGHMDTTVLTVDNIAQLSNFIQRQSQGNAVIVIGDFNATYSNSGQVRQALLDFAADNGLTDAWVQQEYGGTAPTDAPRCSSDNACEQLDKIFYRSAPATDPANPLSSPVTLTLMSDGYQNMAAFFENAAGEQISDHRPVLATLQYSAIRHPAPIAR